MELCILKLAFFHTLYLGELSKLVYMSKDFIPFNGCSVFSSVNLPSFLYSSLLMNTSIILNIYYYKYSCNQYFVHIFAASQTISIRHILEN